MSGTISCPMCGKAYPQAELEACAQKEKTGTDYCCPHCGWPWDDSAKEAKKGLKKSASHA